MIAAVYARKSTEQHEVAEDARSVTRQIERATQYAGTKGWVVAAEHIYSDDGISGAEFEKRPGFLRLMNALRPRAPFRVLIMSEESRLGREQIETAYALKQLITAGVRVFSYLQNRERTLDSPTDKLLLSVTAFADELERDKARLRTRDALVVKAQQGYVTGGRTFGYDNVPILGPGGQRLGVRYQVNPAEAGVVREIFDLCVQGYGCERIAKHLNAHRRPSPRWRPGTPIGWTPSTVGAALRRALYRGELVWGRTAKRDMWGKKRPSDRPQDDWIRRDLPGLRIVSDELWEAAQERRRTSRHAYLRHTDGKLWGRPCNGIDSKYLLTGMSCCDLCGGALTVRHSKKRGDVYSCLTYQQRGLAICANNTSVLTQRFDDKIERC
jgi:site-specific DNA recombinase